MIRKALAFFAAAFVAVQYCLAYETVRYTNSVERENVTYAQRGGMDSSTYVVTNVGFSGSARTLPKYLHYIETDDTYPEDAAWYYSQPQEYGCCSAARYGNYLYRNFDCQFNYAADFIVKVSAADGRFASVGVANCGMHLSEDFVCSHKPSRYYKCLVGSVMDGINENGVVAGVNVVVGDPSTSGWHTVETDISIHPLAAVRWVLDNGKSALDAATNIAARIRFPQGWEQNFHYMVADENETYIVENGEWKKMMGRAAVMTNFRLLPSTVRGVGYERYATLQRSPSGITNVWYTQAYSRDTSWVTDFYDDNDLMEAAKVEWERQGSTKEQHRGKTAAGNPWWHTAHTSIYDFRNRTLRVSVQESDDWYVFGVMTADKLGAYRKIRGFEIADLGDLGDDENINTLVEITGYDKGYDSGIEFSSADKSYIYMWCYFGDSKLYQSLYIEPSGIGLEQEDENGEWHSFTGDFPTNENDSGTFLTTGNVERYALPNEEDKMVESVDFSNAVVRVSPPVVLPQKWALANVTNANGETVNASDVGALSISRANTDQTFNWSPSVGGIRLFGTYYGTGIGLSLNSRGGQLFNYHDDTYDWYDFPTGESGTLALKGDIPKSFATSSITNANGTAIDDDGKLTYGKIRDKGGWETHGIAAINGDNEVYITTDGLSTIDDSGYSPYQGLCVKNDWAGWSDFSVDAIHFCPKGVGQLYYYYFPRNSGTIALEGWKSLSRSLSDACTNRTADSESLSTNICKLIAPHIEPVNVIAELYDRTKKVLWSVTIDNGDMRYGAKTNVDTTAYMQANSVLKDKALKTNWKVRIEDSEMKFDAIVSQ